MGWLKHLAPWLASFSVFSVKAFNLAFFPKHAGAHGPAGNVATDFTDLMIWTSLSLLTSSCWRIWTDDKCLATAQVSPPTGGTRTLLIGERVACTGILVLVIFLAGKGAEACNSAGLTAFFIAGYGFFPAYLSLGKVFNGRFGKDRPKMRAARERKKR